MKRKYKQAYAILVAFVIVAAAYTCRMLAMYDIGGKYPSNIRAVLYLLLFALWGYRPADFAKAGIALSASDSSTYAFLAYIAHIKIRSGDRSDGCSLFMVFVLSADVVYSIAGDVYRIVSGTAGGLSHESEETNACSDSDCVVCVCDHQ